MSTPSLNVTILDENAEITNLNKLHQGKLMVLDFWHSKCVKCPAALEKLNEIAKDVANYGNVMFVSCAISQGPGNKELASEMIADTWENLTHVFMEIDVKEEAKLFFGFTAVPFIVVIDIDGTVLGKGDPKSFDYMSLLKNTTTTNTAASTVVVPGMLTLDEDF